MSADSTVVSTALIAYLAARTQGDDELLAKLKRESLAAGIPAIQISPEQASFMQVLLKLSKAREVVEVGTLAGYSAIQMARALPPGGRVRTVEFADKHADFAEAWVARSDVKDRVTVLRGDGRAVLPRIETDSADACFIDADKAGYETYLRECLRIVRVGGLVMVDNAFAFGKLLDENPDEESVRHVQRFNEVMAKESRVRGIIVPIGDGLWVAVRES
jgi:caffeoyl-CoA O-methyltransferase